MCYFTADWQILREKIADHFKLASANWMDKNELLLGIQKPMLNSLIPAKKSKFIWYTKNIFLYKKSGAAKSAAVAAAFIKMMFTPDCKLGVGNLHT